MQHRVNGREHNVWWNLSRQKIFLTFTTLRVHVTAHNVWWISFSLKNVSHNYCTSSSWYTHDVCWISFSWKTFITFTALRVHGTPMMFVEFPVCQKRFSHLLHFEFMVQHMMFRQFFLEKTFSHIFHKLHHMNFHLQQESFSPLLSKNLIWKYQTCYHCYHHSCPNITAALAAHAQYPRVGRACAVTARQPRQLWHECSALTGTNSLGN